MPKKSDDIKLFVSETIDNIKNFRINLIRRFVDNHRTGNGVTRTIAEAFEDAYYEKVINDEIARPDGYFVNGDSDISKINPKKAKKDISYIKREVKELMEDLDMGRDEAEETAFDSYINDYNKDSNF